MISLADQVAELPDGTKQPGVDFHVLCRYIAQHYINKQSEKDRREKSARRQRFYMSGGDNDMATFITSVIKDPVVQAKRLEFIQHSKWNNVLRRVCHELATVYSYPAKRKVKAENDNARYQELQRACRQHEVMLRANRLAILHRNVLIGPRVRNANGKLEPVLDVITPDCFFAVCHPNDPLSLIAVIIDLNVKSIAGGRVPKFIVWSAAEWFLLDAQGVPLSAAPTPHDVGEIPFLLLSLEPPTTQLLDETTGDDLEAAHRAVWFLGILLMKEAKSATKQHVISGDMSNVTRGQAADTDVPIEAGEGTAVNTIDNSMDLSMYVATIDSVFQTAAANYGLPPSVLKHDGVQSAEARELVRVPLREIRLQQQIPFRDLERDLARLQSKIIGKQIPEFAFSNDGWLVDFADPQSPLGTKEGLDVFEKERQLGLTSTIREIERRNSDLDRQAAAKLLLDCVEEELIRNEAMRPLQAISGSPGALMRDAATENTASAASDGSFSWVKEVLRGAA